MHCFEHRDRPAVGVCRACGKAVCADCVAADCPGIACASGTCAERVRGIAMHNARLSSSLRARLALLVGGGRPQCYDRNAMTRSAPLALLSRRG